MTAELISRILQAAQEREFLERPFFYLYDLAQIAKQLDLLEQFVPKNVAIYYAMKANPHDAILKLIRDRRVVRGFEIASEGELESTSTLKPRRSA